MAFLLDYITSVSIYFLLSDELETCHWCFLIAILLQITTINVAFESLVRDFFAITGCDNN